MSYQLAAEQPSASSPPLPTPEQQHTGAFVSSPASEGLQVIAAHEPLMFATAPSEPKWAPTGVGHDQNENLEAKGEQGQQAYVSEAANPRPWWRRKRIILGVSLLIIIAIALGLGLGLGLKSRGGDSASEANTNGDDEPDDGPNDEQPKICGDSICPQILSSSIYNSDLYIFARTSDNTIAHRVLSDDREWESWVDLGKATGRFISQPWAVTWNVNGELPRLDVFAISSWERVVYNRWLSDSEDWDDNDWFGMGADAGSAISPCIPSRGTLDLWGTSQDTRAITHSWWIEDEDLSSDDSMITSEYGRFWTTEGRWRWEQPLRASRSAPSSVCRNSDVAYDFVYYSQNDVQLIHTWYIFGDEWRSRDLDHGDWIGDPVLVSPDPERWDFFGIQSNNELYHLDWTSTGGYSPMDNLGGNVISQPAILSVDRGVFDVVALGVNGTLQHLHFDGSRWSDDWEDLDIEAHSAPSSFIFKDQVHIAVVASDGHLMVWSREASVEEAWKGSLRSEDLEGDLSLEFLTTES